MKINRLKQLCPLLFICVFIYYNGNGQTLKNKTKYTFQKGVNIAHWTHHLFTGRTYGDSFWFSEKDVKWIANQGLDHIQLRVSGKEISNSDYTLNKERLKVLDSAIHWCKKEKLGTVISLMDFPNISTDTTLTKEEQNEIRIQHMAAFWKRLSTHFSGNGPHLRYNLFGSPSAFGNRINYLNKFNKKVLEQIRKNDPNRIIYLPVSDLDKLNEIQLPVWDKNIQLSFSFDKLSLFEVQFMRPGVIPENFPRVKLKNPYL